MKRKILVVENQSTHFWTLYNYLKYELIADVFPNATSEAGKYSFNYDTFIDHVRVSLDFRYDGSYQESAIEKVKNYIYGLGNIDLAILDYTILNHSSAQNGIHFATSILKEVYSGPVIFLSQKYPDEVDIHNKLKNQHLTYEWVRKGKYRDRLLDKEYLNKVLKPKIDELIKKPDKQHLKRCINQLDNIKDFIVEDITLANDEVIKGDIASQLITNIKSDAEQDIETIIKYSHLITQWTDLNEDFAKEKAVGKIIELYKKS